MEELPGGEPHATDAAPAPDPFAAERVPRWGSGRIRLAALLSCLLAAVLALLSSQGVLSGGASAHPGAVAVCAGRVAPEARALGPAEVAQLRGAVLGAFGRRSGRLYAQGAIGTVNLFTDNPPESEPGLPPARGGYEARWWALDSEGATDNVVIDVLRYGDARRAQSALALAADPRCHRAGQASSAGFVAGGRGLTWLNPDGPYQRDTLLVRGADLYRVSEVPPATATWPVAGGSWLAREHARVQLVTDVLACGLPRAGCNPAAVARAAAAAGLPALAPPGVGPSWPTAAGDAAGYVQAVTVHGHDLPWMTRIAPPAPRIPAGTRRLLDACLPRGSGGSPGRSAAVAWHSGLFAYGGAGHGERAQSWTALLAGEADADTFRDGIERAFADGCVRGFYERSLAALVARDPTVRLRAVVTSPLPVRTQDAQPGTGAHRSDAWRTRADYVATFPGGRRLQLSTYEDTSFFSYRRAVVEVSLHSQASPTREANREYLESALVGRARARWGAPNSGPTVAPAPQGAA